MPYLCRDDFVSVFYTNAGVKSHVGCNTITLADIGE